MTRSQQQGQGPGAAFQTPPLKSLLFHVSDLTLSHFRKKLFPSVPQFSWNIAALLVTVTKQNKTKIKHTKNCIPQKEIWSKHIASEQKPWKNIHLSIIFSSPSMYVRSHWFLELSFLLYAVHKISSIHILHDKVQTVLERQSQLVTVTAEHFHPNMMALLIRYPSKQSRHSSDLPLLKAKCTCKVDALSTRFQYYSFIFVVTLTTPSLNKMHKSRSYRFCGQLPFCFSYISLDDQLP